jgi:transcriptional regulator GlxA family with amidase domain
MTSVHRVAVLLLPPVIGFDAAIPAQLFGSAVDDAGRPLYEVSMVGLTPDPVPTVTGYAMVPAAGAEALAGADTVILPGTRYPSARYEGVLSDELRAAWAMVRPDARRVSICTGAFALAATGLLDGKRATTHWHYTRALAAKHPSVRVDENVLFVDEGSVLTSAGAASGIDLCLHILRGDLGVAASNHAARRLVAAPYRSGGQAQYVPRSVPEPLGERFAATRDWALHRLGEPLTLDILARQAGVSPRTFSRRFVEETGYTPMQWVMRSRIDLARELLERSQRSVEQIAADVGLGTGANLRLHFQRILGTTPSEYRRTFTRGE